MKKSNYILPWGIVFVSIWIWGCGSFFEEKATEMESKNILRKLNAIEPTYEPNVSVPEIYKQEPRIIESTVGDQKDARLYYFARYHIADNLAGLIDKQFVQRFLDAKGKPYPILEYAVSANKSTNQLMVRCPSVADAEQILVFLEEVDVPPIQVKIDCLISEVYADVTMDWETTLLIENLFGEHISLGGKFDSDGKLLPAFPGAALRDAARSLFGLKSGYTKNVGNSGHEFRALVDLLVSRGYLKILMNPSLEVLNGETAKILTSEHVPLEQTTTITRDGFLVTSTLYQDVIDSLSVTPHVFADGYIGLETNAVLGSKSTPEGVKQTPILTRREITNKENRIRQGESLIIGGLRKTEKRSVIRGVPFLKDIPLLGILFSSKDFEERGKEILFIITPTISKGGIPNKTMIEDLRKKHAEAEYEATLTESLTDPFGGAVYAGQLEKRASRTEQELKSAQKKRLEEEKKISELETELMKITQEMAKNKVELEQALAEAEKAGKQAEEAKTNADAAAAAKAQALAEAQKSAAEKAQAQLEAKNAQAETVQARLEAEKAKLETEKTLALKAQVEAEKARLEAEKAQAQAEAEKAKVQAEAEKAKQAEAEKARLEAEKAKQAEAEKAQAEAEKAKQAEAEKARLEAEKAKQAEAEKAKAEK